MKKLNYNIILLFLLSSTLLFTACDKEEYISPLPETNIESSLFGACFERVLTVPSPNSREVTDTLNFPISGNDKSFDSFRITNENIYSNGIRSAIVRLNKESYTETIDGVNYFSQGSELVFKFNISTASDFINNSPFEKADLSRFLVEGKKYLSTVDSLGTIEMAYSCVDMFDDSFCFQDFKMEGLAPYVALNHVIIESIEEFSDLDYYGNVLTEGFKVDLRFEFLGLINEGQLPCEFYSCELNNGKATVYIPYD